MNAVCSDSRQAAELIAGILFHLGYETDETKFEDLMDSFDKPGVIEAAKFLINCLPESFIRDAMI